MVGECQFGECALMSPVMIVFGWPVRYVMHCVMSLSSLCCWSLGGM